MGLGPDTPESEILAAIVANPGLLNRPIVEVGDRAVIARPAEKALDLIKAA
jgi:arsenate reductase (glutaredoxin)